MSSDPAVRRALLRRAAPWVLYAAAAAGALALLRTTGGLASAPAIAEVRTARIACPRTRDRLRVLEVLVTPGERVKAGQVVARMDPAEVDAELAAARQQVAWRASVQRVDGTRAASALARQAEQAALEAERLAAQLERDRSELAQVEVALARELELVAGRVSDLERAETLKLRRAAVQAELARLEQAVDLARRGASGAEGRARRLDPAALAEPAGRVQELEALRARLELVAPFDGRVDEVKMLPGDVADKDGTVLTVVDDRPERAVAYVDQLFANRVRVGDDVRLVPRDRSGPALRGKVTALAPGVAELPDRFRLDPSQRRWGRLVYIRLDGGAALPGQAFDVAFRHAAAAPAAVAEAGR
jgi:multidrug resistance efflux pump